MPRADGHAQASHGRLQAEIEVFESLPRCLRQGQACSRGPFLPGARPCAGVQPGGFAPLLRATVLRRKPVGCFVRATHGADFFRKQWLCVVSVGPGEIVTADGQIDVIGEAERSSASDQMHVDARMPGLEVRPARNQPAHQQRRLAGQHPGPFLARVGAQRVDGLCHQPQTIAYSLRQQAARIREKHPAAATFEQLHTQLVFEQAYGAADCAWGQV